jgi:hypothetical protein
MASLKEYNEFGQLVCTVPGLLAPVTLAGVATVTSEARVTCTSTAGVFPGMVLRCAGFAGPCIVHAVRSTTVLELVASTFSSAGVWTTSAANAAAITDYTGITAQVLSFDPQAIVSAAYAMGTWRNTHRLTNTFYSYQNGASTVPALSSGSGIATLPTTITIAQGMATMTAATIASTDELSATPLKRHNGEQWGFYFAVSTSGYLSKIPAIPSNRLVYAE